MNVRTACIAALAVALLNIAADARPLKPSEERRIKPWGTPLKCITIRAIRSTHVRNDRTIDFYMNGDKVYRSRLPRRCAGLTAEERFSFTTDLPQLCYVDSITVLRGAAATKGASCRLGRFQPITGAPRRRRND
jgi:hypothetical protein